MKTETYTDCQSDNILYDPNVCNTHSYFDRDVELLLCDENHQCPYKRHYNKMVLCTCTAALNKSY